MTDEMNTTPEEILVQGTLQAPEEAPLPDPVVVTPVVETPVTAPIVPSKLTTWLMELLQKISAAPLVQHLAGTEAANAANATAKEDAKNRLRLVLMHDRTQISPSLLEDMRDELMQVISKYVEIDQTALDLCLEQETNTIALVANISVIRARTSGENLPG